MAAPTEVWLVREVSGAIDSREKRIVVIFSGLVLGIRVFGLWFNEVMESGIRETDRNIDKFVKLFLSILIDFHQVAKANLTEIAVSGSNKFLMKEKLN